MAGKVTGGKAAWYALKHDSCGKSIGTKSSLIMSCTWGKLTYVDVDKQRFPLGKWSTKTWLSTSMLQAATKILPYSAPDPFCVDSTQFSILGSNPHFWLV